MADLESVIDEWARAQIAAAVQLPVQPGEPVSRDLAHHIRMSEQLMAQIIRPGPLCVVTGV